MMIMPDIIKDAFGMVSPLITQVLQSDTTNRNFLCVVVTAQPHLNPVAQGQSFEQACYLIAELGETTQTEPRFRQMALSKAEISARTGLPTAEVPAHLLRSGDTTSWGSVVLDGLVVACCGVQSYHDEMFSMWIAAAIKARAKNVIAKLPDGQKFV